MNNVGGKIFSIAVAGGIAYMLFADRASHHESPKAPAPAVVREVAPAPEPKIAPVAREPLWADAVAEYPVYSVDKKPVRRHHRRACPIPPLVHK